MPQSKGIDDNRRRTLRIIAGGGLLLVCGTGGCVSKSKPVALRPQETFCSDIRRNHWLALAARAPSSHNMQPWMVGLPEGNNDIILYLRNESLLPQSDPDRRQAMIALGGFLELLMMAAQADGIHGELTLFPQSEAIKKPIAQLKFPTHPAMKQTDPLLNFVQQRATNRNIFNQNRRLTAADLNALSDRMYHEGVTLQTVSDDIRVTRIGEQVTKAWHVELGQENIMREMLSVTRVGRRENETHRDGVEIRGFLPELAATLGIFSRDRIPAPDSMVMKNMREMGEKQAQSAAAWVWITTDSNSPQAQIAAGREYVRLHLRATQAGIAFHPMTQLLEKYPAMRSLQNNLYQLLEVPENRTVQMLVRVGYADPTPPTLRRTVDVVIL